MLKVSAEPRHFLADVGSADHPHDFLRHDGAIERLLRSELRDAGRKPRLQVQLAVCRGLGDSLDQVAKPAPTALEVVVQVRAFVHPHPLELGDRLRQGLRHRRVQRAVVFFRAVRWLVADAQRMWQAQQIARREVPGNHAPCARALERKLEGRDEGVVQLHGRHGGPPELQRDSHLDPAPGNRLLQQRPDSRFLILQCLWHAHLDVQIPVIHRAKRHADRDQVVLARQGRKPRHALDHQSSVRFPRLSPSAIAAAGATCTPRRPSSSCSS
jgi:hypothetical protein